MSFCSKFKIYFLQNDLTSVFYCKGSIFSIIWIEGKKKADKKEVKRNHLVFCVGTREKKFQLISIPKFSMNETKIIKSILTTSVLWAHNNANWLQNDFCFHFSSLKKRPKFIINQKRANKRHETHRTFFCVENFIYLCLSFYIFRLESVSVLLIILYYFFLFFCGIISGSVVILNQTKSTFRSFCIHISQRSAVDTPLFHFFHNGNFFFYENKKKQQKEKKQTRQTSKKEKFRKRKRDIFILSCPYYGVALL